MIDYTLYPNLNGQLGQNKVQIPDGVTTFWPDGDALVGNFIYKDGKLSGFVDTKALIANDSGNTTIPYDYFNSEFENVREDSVTFNLSDRCKYFTLKLIPKYKGCKTLDDIKIIDENYIENDIVDGVWTKELEDLKDGNPVGANDSGMFYNCEKLITFKTELKSLTNGAYMFRSCPNLIIFESDLNSFRSGNCWGMFDGCTNLTTFSANLQHITSAGSMFLNCENLSSFTSDLSSLENGYYMFYKCKNLPSLNCKNLNSLTNAWGMFINCEKMTSFDLKLSKLTNGNEMFQNCSNLTTFKSDLGSLSTGRGMFSNCSNLTSFKCENLDSLNIGTSMFFGCKSLQVFDYDLKLLTDGYGMFRGCLKISSFNSDLSSLEKGNEMFCYCSNLTIFNSNLKTLTNAVRMFYTCPNLTSFSANLSSLTIGDNMFSGCKLDTQSLKNIAETINTVTELQPIHIGIGNTTPTEEENTYLTQIHNKGWQVYVNGSSTSFTPTDGTSLIPIDGEQNLNPIPFWAKPVPSDEESANYVDENGNFFNILGGQFIFVNDPESYGMFINEEDAATQMRLTKIEKKEMSH